MCIMTDSKAVDRIMTRLYFQLIISLNFLNVVSHNSKIQAAFSIPMQKRWMLSKNKKCYNETVSFWLTDYRSVTDSLTFYFAATPHRVKFLASTSILQYHTMTYPTINTTVILGRGY